MIINDKIEKALAVLPHKPGVYLMHDSTGRKWKRWSAMWKTLKPS